MDFEEGFRVEKYIIDIVIMEVKQRGNNGEAVFFLHGWPDDGTVFESLIDTMKLSFRCYICTLPFGEPR